jgi:hypothetical protein
MMKGQRIAAKAEARKGVSTKPASTSATSTPAAVSTPTAKKMVGLPICGGCRIKITSETRALQCDRCCGQEAWKCADCLCLSVETYEMLTSGSNNELKWFCGPCESELALNKGNVLKDIKDIKDKMDEMMTGLQRLIEQTEVISKSLYGKADTMMMQDHQQHVTTKVDQLDLTVSRKLEELGVAIKVICDKTSNKQEDKDKDVKQMVVVEERVLKLVDAMEKKRADDHALLDCVQDAVNIKLQEDQEELDEIKRRRYSIIVHGLQEPKSSESDKRKEEDEHRIEDLLHQINCDTVSIKDAIRLGRKPETAEDKPRPLKVTIASEEQKEEVLRSAKNLKWKKSGGWNKVFIQQDLTPKQQVKRQKLVLEMKTRQANGEANLMIVSGKIVTRKQMQPREERKEEGAECQ